MPEGEPASGWAGTASERGHFRPDIEGLRAVAVLAVVLFHAGVPGVRGGFVGVDVFYVISGFLITGLLRRELVSTGRIDLVGFYVRRARRLLPAALVVIGVTVLVSILVLSPIRSADVAVDGAWAALYVANYRFAFEHLDYLTDTTISPLLHYWSLAVEEQFYLFWPLLIVVTVRLTSIRRLPWLVVAVGVPSFVLAVALTHIAAPLAFYSLPTRTWQLAIGALLAVAAEPLSRRVPPSLYGVAGWIGLGLIVAGAIFIDPALGYPGIVATVPTIGAAMVIAAGAVGGGPASLLALSLPRWLGRISYSLYLWHWPILILVPIAIGVDGPAIRAPLVLVAVVVAHFSTRWIEQTFRQTGPPRRRPLRWLAGAAAASVAVAAIAFAAGVALRPPIRSTVTTAQVDVDVANPAPVLGSPHVAGPLPAVLRNGLSWAARDLPPSRRDDCQTDRLGTQPIECIYGVEDSPITVAVLGDSHAGQWLSALRDVATERGWRLISFIKAACPPIDTPVWSDDLHRPYDECSTWLRNALERVATEQPQAVIVSGSRGYEVVDAGGRFGFAQRADLWRDGLASVLKTLHAGAGTVVLLADTPRNRTDPIDCLSLHPRFEDCQSPRVEAVDAQYEAIESAAAASSGATLISMNDELCPAAVCPLAFGDYLVYRDSAHLTATFTRILSLSLAGRLPAPAAAP